MEEKTLKRNLLYNTVGNGIYYVCQWLMTSWLVQILSGSQSTYDAGLLSTAATVTNLFLGLAGFGMRNYQVSDLSGQYTDRTYEMSRYLSVGGASLLCLVYAAVGGYGGQQFLCILFFMLYKMMEPLTDVWHGILQKAERMDIIGIAYALRGILSVVLFAAGMLISHNLPVSLLLTAVGAVALCLLYDLRRTAPFRGEGGTGWHSVASLLLQCLPLAVHTFLNSATTNLPRIFLERILGTEQMGVYNLVNSPVLILQVGIAYLFAPFMTHLARRLEEKDRKGFLHLVYVVMGIIAAAGIIGILGCAVFGRKGLELLYHNDTVTGQTALLYPMVLCVVLSCLSVFFCMLLTVLRSMTGLLTSNAGAILTALLLSGPLIRVWGLQGVTAATCAALLVQCLILLFFGYRTLLKRTAEEETEENQNK